MRVPFLILLFQAVCKAIIKADFANKGSHQTILKKVFAGANVYFNHTGEAKCLNIKSEDDIGSSMWDYQACTEMIMPFCFDNVKDMFEKSTWNYTQFSIDCHIRWKVLPRPDMAALMYGERKLDGASNIVFSNGLLDPWSSGGVLRTISKSVVSLIIPEGAHHLDLRGSDPNDPPSVIKAREIEKGYIKKWIDEADARNTTRRVSTTAEDADSIVLGNKFFYS
jgi:lysosomal Pro-X carboxypeptidase